MFVLLSGYGDPHATLAQVVPIFAGTVAFVSRYALRSQADMATRPSNAALFHQLLGYAQFMLLAWREQKRDRPSLSIATEMDLGA